MTNKQTYFAISRVLRYESISGLKRKLTDTKKKTDRQNEKKTDWQKETKIDIQKEKRQMYKKKTDKQKEKTDRQIKDSQ